MANREQKGNREKRKPKAEKAKPAPSGQHASQPVGPAMGKSGGTGKKGR